MARKAMMAAALTPLLTAIFAALVTLAFMIPNGAIKENILDRPDVVDDRRADNGRVIDADTECIGLSVGLYASVEANSSAFHRAMQAESLYGCDQFLHWLNTGDASIKRDYFRYWHGYTVVSRPILSIMPYNDLRGLLFYVSVALLGGLVWRLGKDFGAAAGFAALAPFLVINTMGYWVVATKAVTWFLIVGGALYFARFEKNQSPPVIAFFLLGALTAFFDYLTAPATIFATAALVHFLYRQHCDAIERPFARLLWIGVFWAAGYVGLWGMKFLLAATFLDLDVVGDVAQAAAFRFRGASEHVDSFLPGIAIYENFAALKTLWAPIAILVFLVSPFATVQRRRRWIDLWRGNRVILFIAAIPLLWLEALSNHSQIHAAFTQMNFAPFFLLAGLVLFNSDALARPKGKGLGTGHEAR